MIETSKGTYNSDIHTLKEKVPTACKKPYEYTWLDFSEG